jgi:hypothetical protein
MRRFPRFPGALPPLAIVGLVVCLIVPSAAIAQPPDRETERSERLAEMRRRARELRAEVAIDGISRRVELLDEPLLRFSDPTRHFSDGTVWAWSLGGRPLALAAVERYEDFWSYELIALASDGLRVTTADGWTWQPGPGLTRAPVADAPQPADASDARLLQARRLAREFRVVEFIGPEESRVELRLQPRPIMEYADAEAGVLCGALFVFSNGTNPEALLLVEAAASGDKTLWQFAFAPLSTAALEAARSGQRVWRTESLHKPRQQAPYTYFADPPHP